ncbi:hypothetical protein [Stomatohabitans albus]|uniref:PulJ/GspJ family protein n=1 Tax=Stomatohabitans albus TaxID=3110766 RepID=UPI00300D8CDF
MMKRPTQSSQRNNIAAGEDGLTLTELMVTMLIASIIGGLVLATVIMVGNIVTRVTERTEEFVSGQQALDEISLNVRGAVPNNAGLGRIVSASPSGIVFFTHSGVGLSNKPILMSYQLINDELRQVRYPGDTIVTDKTAQSRMVIDGILDNEIFEYYTWADPKKYGGSNKCFRKIEAHEFAVKPTLENGEVVLDNDGRIGIHARDAIAGIKISFHLHDKTNSKLQEPQEHTKWVRIGEFIDPKDPETGALIKGWPRGCWEIFDDN